jgi:hypothetical protein
VVERGVDLVADRGDAFGEVDEGPDPAAAGPGQPAVQRDLAGLALDGEHVAQAFFEQVGAVQSWVGLGDPGQLVPLLVGEVVGVFPQRVAGALEPAGITGGDAVAVALATSLPGAAGVVPGLPADLVEGFGGPLDHMERVGALHRGRAAFGDDLGDPVGLIGRHVRDRGAALGAEQLEERPQRGPVPAGRGPHQPARIVVDDDGEVAVLSLVGDLVDANAGQPIEPVTEGFDVGPHAGDDRPDGAPGDAHQLRDRGLRALRHQPGHGLVEGQRVPHAVPGPRHMRDDDAVLRTADSRRLGFQQHRHRAQIQRPPPAPPLTGVVTPAAPPADTAPVTGRPGYPHMSDQQAVTLVTLAHLAVLVALAVLELDLLDNGLLHAQQGAPYPGVAHAVLRSPVADP